MKHFMIIYLVGIGILFSMANLYAQWEPDVRLTFDDASSRIYYNNAWQMAAVGDTIHVVWEDDRDGNDEIYYKRNPTGNTGIQEDQNIKSNIPLIKVNVFPNPFTTLVSVKCQVPGERENITLNIYDVSGKLVKSFSLSTAYSLLPTVVSWDGTDNSGNELQSGIFS